MAERNKEAAPKLDDVLGKELHRTGSDIPEGSYPGTLYGFGEPFMLAVSPQFRKPGQPDERPVMELKFGIFTKDGLQAVQRLVPVPENGAANRRSNLYKDLKSMRGADPAVFDNQGNFVKGVNLQTFIGSNATIQVKKNAKDFPTVEQVASPMQGVKFPTLEECEKLKELEAASEDIPF